MNAILPSVVLFVLFILLFFREIRLERKRFLEADRLGDEHILREVERFVKEMNDKNSLYSDDWFLTICDYIMNLFYIVYFVK